MTIFIKNKYRLQVDGFTFKCCVGKNGIAKNKIEGDKKTPFGIYHIENLYYRKDRIKKPFTRLKCVEIKKSMGWSNDSNNLKTYNKLVKIKKDIKCEKIYRKDHKYDLFIPIKYNFYKPKKSKGSCIFIHLTKNYKPTAGCIALEEKDFLILIKIINQKTKIKIN